MLLLHHINPHFFLYLLIFLSILKNKIQIIINEQSIFNSALY